jgi:hypothetical protein
MANESFLIQFDKAVDMAMKEAEAIYSMGTDMMFNSIIVGAAAPHTVVSHSGTPLDTGFARASWWKNIGSVGKHPNQPVPVPSGQKVSATLASSIPLGKLGLGDRAFLANNAEYIRKLEFDSHSRQAPQGMVRITIAEAPRFWELAKQRLRSGK